MKKILFVLYLFVASLAQATTVSGTAKTDGGATIKSGSIIFNLQGCTGAATWNGGTPVPSPVRINLTSLGVASGTVIGNDAISCGTNATPYWNVKAYLGPNQTGIMMWSRYYSITGSTFNVGTAVPMTTLPSPGGGNSPVNSVFGRVGIVGAQNGDYSVGQIGGLLDINGLIFTNLLPALTAGLGDPGSNGIIKRTALNTTAPASSSDITSLLGYVPDNPSNKPAVNAISDCSVPTDGVTDAYSTIQACVNAHPSAHLIFPKVAAYGSCDYVLSQTVMLLGAGQWIQGGSGEPSTGSGAIRFCPQLGVTAFWGNNQYAAAFRITDLAIVGSEPFSTIVLADFVLPFGWSYPSIAWLTGSTSTSTTLTTTGASELFLTQNVGQTVQVVAGGSVISTDTCSNATGSATITCTGAAQSHVGQSIYVPGAGAAAGNISAKIIGFTGTGYQLDMNLPTSTSSVTASYAFDLYATISSRTDSHHVVLSKAGGNNLSGLTVYVGSRADGIRINSNFAKVENVTVTNMGRDGIRNLAGGNIGDLPYLSTGAASNLADDNTIIPMYIGNNRGSGIYIAGGDGNNTKVIGGDMAANQLWGYIDNSFLGSSAFGNPHTATNHNDCTTKPCPSLGGGTDFTTSTATLQSATVQVPAAGADWVCNTSNSVTTGGSTPFLAGQVGMVITLPGCGSAGSTLVTTVATFVSSSSITITDAASSTNTVTATARIWPTVTKTAGTAFASGMVGQDISILNAGANGQALYAKIAQFYNANTVAIDTAPPISVLTTGVIYYGLSNYAGRDTWMGAWTYSTGAITSGLKVLTLTGANELAVNQWCTGATANFAGPQITVVGAGPGGTNLNTTCTTFTNSQSITLATAAGTTVSGATVYVAAIGGSYWMPNNTGTSIVYQGYGEGDQSEGNRMAATPNAFLGGLQADGVSSVAPGTTYVTNAGFLSPRDSNFAVALQGGKTKSVQTDFYFEDFGNTVIWDLQKTSVGSFSIFNSSNSTKQRLSFAQGNFSEFDTDQTLTGTAEAFRFKCGTGAGTASCLRILNDGSLDIVANSAFTTKFHLTGTPTAARTVTLPDSDINVIGSNVANTYTAGAKQKVGASSTTAGFAFAGTSTDPSVPAAGDEWYNTTGSGRRKFYDGATVQTYAWLSDVTGGAAAFNAITGGTNTSAAMVCGTGCSISTSGSGTNSATTAANLSGTPALPNGTTATTQAANDNSTKLATTAYVATAIAGSAIIGRVSPLSDIICAHGSDTTIGQLTITGATNASPPVFTVSSSPITMTYLNGQTFTVTGVTPSAYNGTYTVTATPTSTTLTGSGAAPGSAYTSGGTIYMPCNNSSDATVSTQFATTITVPANTFVTNTRMDLAMQLSAYTTSTAPTLNTPVIRYGAVNVVNQSLATTLPATSTFSVMGELDYKLVSPLAGYIQGTYSGGGLNGLPASWGSGSQHNPQVATTTSSQVLSFTTTFSSTGIASITGYTSGATVTGSIGQTCTLATFNNGNTGASYTATLTSANTLTGATFTQNNTGFGSTSAATTATASSGTATCSGTATITTTLGGAQGNAVRLSYFDAILR